MTVQDLTDAILRHALELQRLADHDGEEAARLLTQLEEELRALAASKTLSEANKREVDAIIAQAQEAIEARYGQVSGVVDMQGIVAVVAENTAEAMQAFYPQASTPERLASLARSVLIEGAPTAAWWARQSEDTAFRFAQAVRQGVVEGQTQEQIVSRIAGRNGFMEIARRNARTLVHSSVMSAANQARLATFRKHMREGDALEWLATLDSSVCPVCAALDGKQWDGEGKAVRGNKFAFRVPPAHHNCRCVLTIKPGLKGIEAVDSIMAEQLRNLGGRSSQFGPTGNDTSMEGFLQRQSPQFVEGVLGRKRADLFLAGKITLNDLVTKAGRFKSLDELRAR